MFKLDALYDLAVMKKNVLVFPINLRETIGCHIKKIACGDKYTEFKTPQLVIGDALDFDEFFVEFFSLQDGDLFSWCTEEDACLVLIRES